MNLKKIFVSMLLVILIFFNFQTTVRADLFGNDDTTDIEKTIDKDEGGLFEKIIAKMIGGLAETVFDLTTKDEFRSRI